MFLMDFILENGKKIDSLSNTNSFYDYSKNESIENSESKGLEAILTVCVVILSQKTKSYHQKMNSRKN